MIPRLTFLAIAIIPLLVSAAAYDIAADMALDSFWTNDPVLFVKRHGKDGFSFTSDDRTSADSRLDGGVSYGSLPVYETKVSFGDAGGIERVELVLFATGGTETYKEFVDENGKRFLRRTHVAKTISREDYVAAVKTVRETLTAAGTKPPVAIRSRKSDPSVHQASQTWPQTAQSTQATLTWNFTQNGKDESSFSAGFIRLAVNGPTRMAGKGSSKKKSVAADKSKGAAKITDNVVKDPRGDVFIDNVPMVDQGQKGYCAVATAERVLRYYNIDIDEHEIAQAAGTKVDGGTSILAMKQSVDAIGRRYRLATVVCYGDFEKSASERIAGICDEVKAYNKAAKKLKRPPITDDMYIHREGNTIYYSYTKVDEAMDAEVLKEMKVNGMQKAKYTKFLKDIREQVAKGIPLFWSVNLGTYPEPGLMQSGGSHMRLIIGYNDKKKEILYSDSWGAGHELKRMPADWAWTISRCLVYMKPLSK